MPNKKWTPPASDKITNTWTPPESDRLEPIKKKVQSGIESPTSFQPSNIGGMNDLSGVPSPLIGKAAKEYKPSQATKKDLSQPAGLQEAVQAFRKSKGEGLFAVTQNIDAIKEAEKVNNKIGGAGTSFMANVAGVNKGLAKLPRFIYEVASAPQNLAANLLNMPELKANYDEVIQASGYQSPLSVIDKLGDLAAGEENKYNARLKKYDADITESLSMGNFSDAGAQIVNNISGSIPSMVLTAMSGGIGSAAKLGYYGKTLVSALPFASTKMEEISKDTSIPEYAKPVVSILNGLSEVIFDQSFGAQAAIKNIVKLFKEQGKDAAEKAAKDLADSYIKRSLKSLGTAGKGIGKGAIEEGSTKISQNIADWLFNPDKDLMDGVADAVIVGGATTGTIETGGKILLGRYNKNQKKKLTKLAQERSKIIDDLDKENVSEEVKSTLKDALDVVDAKIDGITEDAENEINIMPSQVQGVVTEKQREIESLSNQLQDENISDLTKQIITDRIKALESEVNFIIDNANKEQENAIQEPSTESQVSPVGEAGQVITEGGEGVGQSIQGNEATQDVKPEEVIEPLKDVESTATALENFRKSVEGDNFQNPIDSDGTDAYNSLLYDNGLRNAKELSEEYHKAKLDGSNPDLVKAVEDLLAPKVELTTETTQQQVERLRAEEQAEYDAMENPEDEAERQKIYDKYDKLITPLLEEAPQNEVTALATINDVESAKEDVNNAKGKKNKITALISLRDVATDEQFQQFMDENPKFKRYIGEMPEQKKLGGSRIVGQAIAPDEFAEYEEVSDENAEKMLKDSIETPFRNQEAANKKSRGIVSRIITAVFDSQYDVIKKLLDKGGDLGKIAVAAFKNRKGYNGKASILNREFNKQIFDDLSSAPNIDIVGRKTSERELFDTFLNLNRIINIDTRIKDKFAQLIQVSEKIKKGIENKSLTEEQLNELRNEEEALKDYLLKRDALEIKDGEYLPKQYLHSGNRTAATARAELNIIKRDHPELFNKLDDLSQKYYDSYKFLLYEQYKNGMISKPVYDELFSYNYIPTKYIQHFIENDLADNNPVLAAKLSSSIKNLTGGSDADAITNFQTILNLYTNSVYKKIYENRAANSLAKVITTQAPSTSTELMRTDQLVKESDAKLTDKPMYNMDLNMYIQEPTGVDKFGNPTYDQVPKGYDTIYFYEKDGKRQRIVAPKDFVDIWYDRNGLKSPQVDKALSFVSKWSGVNLFKSLITKNNPAFGIYQILQDAPQALIATNAYPDFLLGSAQLASDYASVSKDIFKFIKNDELTPLFKEAIDAGIFSDFLSTENDLIKTSSLVNSDGTTNYKTVLKSLSKRVGKATTGALDSIAQMNEAVEYFTRLAVYKRMRQNLIAKYTKENGGKAPDANQMFEIQQLSAEQSRNVVDFSRSGTFVKPLNKVFAYLNAGIQAFYSSARSLKNNPIKAATMLTELGVGGVSVLAISLGAFGGDEKEKKKRLAKYMMLSKYQKANYFNIYNPYTDDPEMEWIKIPKPQPFRGWINLLEQGYLHNVMNQDIDMDQAKEAFFNDLPLEPSILDLVTRNPLVNATVKYSLNKDVYRNQDVVKNAEKIEDWAEGVDDENVSQIYKELGKSSKGLLGKEGLSPKRSQAFTQSLIGDPSRNTTTAFLDKAGKSLFYAVNDDKKGMDEEWGDRTVLDNIFISSGLKGRLFTKTPKLDNSFMETLDEQRKELFTKHLLIRSEAEELYDKAPSKQEAAKRLNKRLTELVNNNDISTEYKKIITTGITKKAVLKDKPSWYKSLLYAQGNDEKIQILKHYAMDMSKDESQKLIKFLLVNKIASPQVTKQFAIMQTKK